MFFFLEQKNDQRKFLLCGRKKYFKAKDCNEEREMASEDYFLKFFTNPFRITVIKMITEPI